MFAAIGRSLLFRESGGFWSAASLGDVPLIDGNLGGFVGGGGARVVLLPGE